jgi:hypothetical protein
MRPLGLLLAAIVLLPFVQAAAQLLVLTLAVLTVMLALKHPQETLGCIVLFGLIGLLHRYPVAGSMILGILVLARMLESKRA